MSLAKDFWKGKTLAEMNQEEWDALCDGCGQCCLHKIQDIDTNEVFYTQVACRFLDLKSVRCKVYAQRTERMPTCLTLTPDNVMSFQWLPETCAYRCIAEGKELPEWHPLVSSDTQAILRSGASVRAAALSEDEIDMDRLEDYIIE